MREHLRKLEGMTHLLGQMAKLGLRHQTQHPVCASLGRDCHRLRQQLEALIKEQLPPEPEPEDTVPEAIIAATEVVEEAPEPEPEVIPEPEPEPAPEPKPKKRSGKKKGKA